MHTHSLLIWVLSALGVYLMVVLGVVRFVYEACHTATPRRYTQQGDALSGVTQIPSAPDCVRKKNKHYPKAPGAILPFSRSSRSL